MPNKYHILNGDSLAERFPEDISGEIIIARECLVDGPVESKSLDELFELRALFISGHYDGFTRQNYYDNFVPEVDKVKQIPPKSEVNLWFEDDLFCQVNFWFFAHLLSSYAPDAVYYLVRPFKHTSLGFSAYSKVELSSLLDDRIPITNIDPFSQLWKAYQGHRLDELSALSQTLHNQYPFIRSAVQAHLDRQPSTDNLGRPERTIKQIMKELETKEFVPVFKEFSKREAIYGYGDIQVKRIFDRILAEK